MTSATVGAIDIVAWFVYLFSAVLFVVGLHFMNSPKTARKGNQISAFGMVVAVLMAFIVPGPAQCPPGLSGRGGPCGQEAAGKG